MNKDGNEPLENKPGKKVKPLIYKKAKGKLLVEYGRQGDDMLIQIHLPYPKQWLDPENKDLYKKLMKMVDKHISSRTKIHYFPPNEKMKDLLTIRAIDAYNVMFFNEDKVKTLANQLAKASIFLATT